MSFPDLPYEIWPQILERACQDDGTTAISLSQTSRELRMLSEPYRFQSVQINGWRQLKAFEQRMLQAPQAKRGVFNLMISLTSVLESGYPGVPKWAPDEDS